MIEGFGAWLDANPVSVLVIAIVIIILILRGLVKNQGLITRDLVKSTSDLAKGLGELRGIVEYQITAAVNSILRQEEKTAAIVTSVLRQEEKTSIIETRLDTIEQALIERKLPND
jgi:hypothetical protein